MAVEPADYSEKQNLRQTSQFLISALAIGHAVFHWIIQSFVVLLPEIQSTFHLSGVGVGGQPGLGVPGGTGNTDTVLDPVVAAPATIGPSIGDLRSPSEIYAPNSSTEIEAEAGAWSTEAGSAVQVISAETESQSRYLEGLFEDFASPTTPEATPAPAVSEPAASETSGFPRTTRD